MTEVILDPSDPHIAFIGDATDSRFGIHVGHATLMFVHDFHACQDHPCVIHRPSQHHMRGWRLTWRDDKGVMERFCPHGVGHPDPDDAAHLKRVGHGYLTIHGCDGCCRPEPPEDPNIPPKDDDDQLAAMAGEPGESRAGREGVEPGPRGSEGGPDPSAPAPDVDGSTDRFSGVVGPGAHRVGHRTGEHRGGPR